MLRFAPQYYEVALLKNHTTKVATRLDVMGLWKSDGLLLWALPVSEQKQAMIVVNSSQQEL